MPYTIIVAGTPVHCETAEEATALAKLASGNAASSVRSSNGNPDGSGSRWTDQRLKDFFRGIKAQQRKLVDALLETTDGRTDEQLCQLLGLPDGRNLAGVFTGLWKNAKKVGADPKDLYLRQTVTIGDRKQQEYTLSDSFRSAVKKWR